MRKVEDVNEGEVSEVKEKGGDQITQRGTVQGDGYVEASTNVIIQRPDLRSRELIGV